MRVNDNIQVIDELRRKYPLKELLKLAKIARSTFYYHLNKSKLPDKYAKIKDEIYNIYHANKGRYGYRRITLALKK